MTKTGCKWKKMRRYQDRNYFQIEASYMCKYPNKKQTSVNNILKFFDLSAVANKLREL